jgi:hypothetical protein
MEDLNLYLFLFDGMEAILFNALQKGLEDIIGKFNKGLNSLEKLGNKEYHLRTDDNVMEIYRTSRISRKGHSKVMMDIELQGNIIVATPQSSDWRLDKVRDYLQTFSDKYDGKGVTLRYVEFKMPIPIPPPIHAYDNI